MPSRVKPNDATRPAQPPGERKIVFLLCLLGAIHVFIFSAAFPLFNLNDEAKHYDLVLKYSRGEFQREMAPMSEEWMRYYAVYASLEYLNPPELFPNKQMMPPPWTMPADLADSIVTAREQQWRTLNHESSQPPLYYLAAGMWWWLGKLCGFKGGYLLYWVRFLNIAVVAALVWLGYVAARLVFPERRLVRLGVPAVLASLPQTVFYSVTNDILSPLCFGLAFICLVRWLRADAPTMRQGIALGLALAATFLTKMCNLPVFGVAGIFILIGIIHLHRAKKLTASWPSVFWLAACAGIPTLAWAAWCKHNFGDFTGAERKIQLLGWTHKPFAEWFHHPIFSPGGLWTFVSGLFATFWRGEFSWYDQPLASAAADGIYMALSLGLPGIALANLCRRPANTTPEQRRTLWLCFGGVLATMAFLGLLSVMYDFHNCIYPSREHPYFTSGRLLLGSLIPFLLLCLYGLDCALSAAKGERVRWLAVGGIVLFMLVSESAVDARVFASQYNWFHLGGSDVMLPRLDDKAN